MNVLIFVLPFIAFSLSTLFGCGSEKKSTSTEGTDTLTTNPTASGGIPEPSLPVIENLSVNLGQMVAGDRGDFEFTGFSADLVNTYAVFDPFDRKSNGKYNDSMVFYTKIGANVVSPITGYVHVISSEGGDFEVHITPDKESTADYLYFVYLDHVTDLKVSVDDAVQAGEVIGKVGNWTADFGRIEMAVAKAKQGPNPNRDEDANFCPFKFFKADKKDQYKALVTKLMADWETAYGNTNVYDEASMSSPGCYVDECKSHSTCK